MSESDLAKLFFLLLIVFLSVDGAVITVPPVSVTVPPFITATFTCEGTGNTLSWLVRSDILTDSVKQQREISVTTTTVNNTNFSSVLTVNAIPINDGLGIGCEVISYNLSNPFNPFNRVTSNSALTIRGISPVEDLLFNFSSGDSLIITWPPPVYFSNDIPIGSPVSYEVKIIIGDEISIEDTITTNTNIVEVYNITQCDTFSVSVKAHVGQYTSNNETKENYGNCTIKILKVFQTFHEVIIHFEIKCSPLLCNKIFLAEASHDDNVYSEKVELVEENSNMINYLFMNYSVENLLPFQHYQVVLKLLSLTMINEDQDIKCISTYNVQDLLVSIEGNGAVSVQCVFVSGSTADGCHVIFTDTSNGRNDSFTITGSDNRIVSVSAGNYIVAAFDIHNGSLYGPAVYYPTLVEVVIVTMPVLPASSSLATFASSTNGWWSETMISSPAISVDTTMLSPESSSVQLLPIIFSALGAVILVIVLFIVTFYLMKRKKRNEVTEEIIDNNPAYGQVLQMQNHPRSNVRTDVNPAYETLAVCQLRNMDYETVW